MGTALITGATSGIGLEIAWELAAEKNDLVLVARNKERLEKIAEEMRQIADVRVEVLSADLSTMEGALAVAERVANDERPVGLLVNNAGFGLGQDFVGGSLNRELQGLNTMVRAVLITCHAAADAMTRRGYGGILNVASMTALTAQGTYSAHKAWVRTFTEGLAARLEGTGVTVTAVCPGLVHTEFHERAAINTRKLPSWVWVDADTCVAQALADSDKGKVISLPTWKWKAAGFALQHQSDRRAAQAPQPADDLAQRRIAQREAGQRVVLSWPVLCRLR